MKFRKLKIAQFNSRKISFNFVKLWNFIKDFFSLFILDCFKLWKKRRDRILPMEKMED